jgi:RNA polymerase sigma-70 factor (ECF subfamily)
MSGITQEKLASPGIPQAAEQIFEEYAPWVSRVARRLLRNEADVDDVTQDVFLQVVRKLPSFRGDAAFPTWLYRVTVNAALSYRRKQAARREYAVPELPDNLHEDGGRYVSVRRSLTNPEKRLLEQETHRLIETAIARLPEAYRHVYVLADVTEVSNTKIAGMLGLSVAAVKSRLHRARLLMRKSLAPHHEEYAA